MKHNHPIKLQIKLHDNTIFMFLSICISIFLMISCGPRVQKPDDAFTLIKKERMLSDDSSFVSKEVIQASMKTQPVKKSETADEWTKFKVETEKKIKQNTNNIQKIKEMPDMNNNMRKKLTSLEKDNNNLKMSLDEYPEEVKAKWEAFKSSMNHNANEIGIELNAIMTDQKK